MTVAPQMTQPPPATERVWSPSGLTGAPRETPAGARESTPWLALAALTLLALALRLFHVNGGLWVDEISGLLDTFRGSFAEVLTQYVGDVKHPLYAVLTNRVMAIFGEAPWALRLVAVVFGAASVPALYFFARTIVSRREALLAAALLTLSYHHVWFSQNARGYTMLVFFTLVSTTLMLRALDSGRRSTWIWFGVAAALGVYTHLTMVFAVGGQALATLWALATRRERLGGRAWTGAALGFATAGALALALYAPILSSVVDYFLNKPSELRGVSSTTWALGEAVRVLRLGLGATGVLGVLVIAVGLVTLAAGAIDLLRRHTTAALAMSIPVALTILGAFLARGTMYPRFFFFLIGFALVIVVRGAMIVGGWVARPRFGMSGETLGTAAVGVLLIGSAAALPLNYRWPKQDYDGAMRFVESARRDGDRVVTAGYPAMAAYVLLNEKPWPRMMSAAELRDARAGGRVWMVYAFPRYVERGEPDVWAVIQRECDVQRVFRGTVGGGDVVVCTLERT